MSGQEPGSFLVVLDVRLHGAKGLSKSQRASLTDELSPWSHVACAQPKKLAALYTRSKYNITTHTIERLGAL
eukprot:COSAG02_NODE_304_length_25204_cov_11.025095_13_plen_72_part_00